MRKNGKRSEQKGQSLSYYDILVSVKKMYPDMSILDIQRTTIADYEVLIEAYQLRKLDEELSIHLLAWQTVQEGASNKQGKPVYSKFSKFFDYEKRQKEIKGDIEDISEEEMSIFEKIKIMNESR